MTDEILNMKQRQAMEILLSELRSSRTADVVKAETKTRIVPKRVVRASAARTERRAFVF